MSERSELNEVNKCLICGIKVMSREQMLNLTKEQIIEFYSAQTFSTHRHIYLSEDGSLNNRDHVEIKNYLSRVSSFIGKQYKHRCVICNRLYDGKHWVGYGIYAGKHTHVFYNNADEFEVINK